MSEKFVVLETRRSKGYHKADLTEFSKEDVKKALDYFGSNSYVAVKNYRAKGKEEGQVIVEIKFHRMSAKGQVKYSLKTLLTVEDLKSLGFVESPKKNMHLTKAGCTMDLYFDVEVKEPVKKISSKKTEKKNEEKVEKDSSKKTPLPHPDSKKVKVEEKDEDIEDDEDVEEDVEEDEDEEVVEDEEEEEKKKPAIKAIKKTPLPIKK